ncbi:MAG: glycosyltransferase family 4 protein [Deltaproteobacteria bacterium]
MNKKGIIFIRNSNFQFDSRMQRAANTALKLGINVIVLNWIRDKSQNHPEVIKLANGVVGTKYFYKLAPFGKGLKNIVNLVQFNRWIYHQLRGLRNEYDILHVCDLDVVLSAYLISIIYNKKIVYDIFDFFAHTHTMPLLLKKIVELLEYKIISLVDFVIVCNEVRVILIEKANPKNCIVIHNTPDIHISVQPPKIINGDENVFRIAYTGTLAPAGRLLFEISQQASKHKNIEIHIAGIGPLDEYFTKMAQEHANLFYYGHILIEQALQLESECSLLFATYDPTIDINKYSAPNKVSEAMALKKPIIVCRGTGADEIVQHHEMGLVIDYDADEFWKAASFLSDSKEVCAKMGINGRKAYEELYSWEIMEGRLTKLYNSFLTS